MALWVGFVLGAYFGFVVALLFAYYLVARDRVARLKREAERQKTEATVKKQGERFTPLVILRDNEACKN
jgi:hypothetical protein